VPPKAGSDKLVAAGPSARESRSAAKADAEAILTDRLEMFRIDRVEAALPVTFKLQALQKDATRQQLLSELARARDFRLELPCRGGTLAFGRLEPALKALGLSLAIDQAAQQRLQVPQLRTNYVIYLEDLLPQELAGLMDAAIREDQRVARKTFERQFDRMVLTRMSPQDHKELSTLLGTDPTEAPPTRGTLTSDPRKPLADLTARQVADSLAGQGGNPRPAEGASAAAPGERLAVVLAYNPVRPHANSTEVQRFLRARKSPRPGSLRILLVLRG
jgi:hypothetical protein